MKGEYLRKWSVFQMKRKLIVLNFVFMLTMLFGVTAHAQFSETISLVSLNMKHETFSSSFVKTEAELVLNKPESLFLREIEVEVQNAHSPKSIEIMNEYHYTDDSTITLTLESPNFQEEGAWNIKRITVIDEDGNRHDLNLTKVTNKTLFTLYFPKPKLTKVEGIEKSFDITQLNKVKPFYMTIDLQGLNVPDEELRVILENKAKKEDYHTSARFDSKRKQFVVDGLEEYIDMWNGIGTWQLKEVSFYDSDTNHSYNVQIPNNLKQVFQIRPDTTLPVFKSAKVTHSKTKGSQLIVHGDDNSGFYQVKAQFKHLASGIVKTIEPWEGHSKVAEVKLERYDFGIAGKWELVGLELIDMYENKLKVKSVPKKMIVTFEEYDVHSRNFVVANGTVKLTKLFEEDRYIERIIVLEGATLIVNVDSTFPIHSYGTVVVEKGKHLKNTVYAKQFKNGTGKKAGTVYLKGSNRLQKRVVTKTPYNLGIVELNKGISLNEDKKTFNLKGLAFPGTKAVKIDGKSISVQKNGAFAKNGLVAKGKVVVIEVTDRYGKKHVTKHKIYDYKPATATVNLKPGIYLKGTVLKVKATKDAEVVYNGFQPGNIYPVVGGMYRDGIPLNKSLIYELELFDPALGKTIPGPKGEYIILDLQKVSDLDRSIKGTTKPATSITVRVNGKTYKTVADRKGKFKIDVDLKKATSYTIQAVNGKLKSSLFKQKVIDKTAPVKASISEASSKSGIVKGKAEPTATVVMTYGKKTVQAQVKGNGTFSINIKGLKKNSHLYVQVKDRAGNKSVRTKHTIR